MVSDENRGKRSDKDGRDERVKINSHEPTKG
jgi:hypothetical protein